MFFYCNSENIQNFIKKNAENTNWKLENTSNSKKYSMKLNNYMLSENITRNSECQVKFRKHFNLNVT